MICTSVYIIQRHFDIKTCRGIRMGESLLDTSFRFHSVVVSTLDFESNNTSSNLVGSNLHFTPLTKINVWLWYHTFNTFNTMAMKSRRCTKSTKSKRRSSKRGGMYRRPGPFKHALKKIFGENPVDAADKAKQAADKAKQAADAIMKATAKKPSPYRNPETRQFSSPVSFGSPFVETRDKYKGHYDPDAFLRTPSKKPDTNEPKLPKSARHQSVVATTPHSYAPIFGDAIPVNQRLFL